MGLNEQVAAISPSLTLLITDRAKALAAAGEKVWNLAGGEPDFDTPDHIKAAAAQALTAGQTKYSPNNGLWSLREAVADKLRKENGLDYPADRVVVTNGGKQALFNVLMTLCRPGDEVVIPAPYWLSYPEMVHVAGGKPVFLPTEEQDAYLATPDRLAAALTPKTRAVVINSPSNPTGAVYPRVRLAAIAEVLADRDLYVIADEIYEHIIYDGAEHVSIGSLNPKIFSRTITVNGLSKAYSMTGWRLGYCAGPADVVRAVSALQSHSTSGPNTFAQYGGLAALQGSQECVRRMAAAFAVRRDAICEGLARIPGLTCVRPLGAFYAFPNISRFGLDSVTFAERLLEEQRVAVIPGRPFGADSHIRLSYSCGTETIAAGLERLAAFVAGL